MPKSGVSGNLKGVDGALAILFCEKSRKRFNKHATAGLRITFRKKMALDAVSRHRFAFFRIFAHWRTLSTTSVKKSHRSAHLAAL